MGNTGCEFWRDIPSGNFGDIFVEREIEDDYVDSVTEGELSDFDASDEKVRYDHYDYKVEHKVKVDHEDVEGKPSYNEGMTAESIKEYVKDVSCVDVDVQEDTFQVSFGIQEDCNSVIADEHLKDTYAPVLKPTEFNETVTIKSIDKNVVRQDKNRLSEFKNRCAKFFKRAVRSSNRK